MSAQTAAAGRPYAGKSLADRRSEQLERILLAARDVFAMRGYAGAGVDEIVARARVSRTTFYAFYENKEECLLAVFRLGLERIGAVVAQAAALTAEQGLAPPALIRAEVRATLAAFAADPSMARIVLIEIVGATPAAERMRARARNVAATIIQRRLEEYAYWRKRPEQHRRVASLAAMAAIGEPISDLVATGRIDEWEALVEPVSEFIGRALIDPADLP
ncbi:MAG: TetR/AcrR family transcriptional regulator [Actinobacteria bacterium]|nr:MAG: TetR/AcrR family transcriptional regulator [Actinomycetota bacterium]